MEGTAAGARVELCGRLRVEVGGSPAGELLRGDRLVLLLAYLVLNRERACTRDELAEALWRDDPPESPGSALSVLLTRLRRALGAEALSGRSQLQLTLPAPVLVDVEEALAALGRARSGGRVDSEERLEGAARATAILEHELLPGVQAPWLDDRREELLEALADALEITATVASRLGEDALGDAERAGRRLIEIAPYRETGYRALMEAHAARGNLAEALKVYEVLRVLLREELGVAPARDVQALHERLLEGGVAFGASGSTVAALPPPPLLAAADADLFVGRTAALDRVGRAATTGTVPFVVIPAEAGMGKTRLAARFAAASHSRGAMVLYGRCGQGGPVGYAPFAEALGHYVENTPPEEVRAAAGAGGRDLARLPAIGSRLGGPPPASVGTPGAQRHRLFEAVAALLGGLAARAPLVLILDDLHWADGPSVSLLRHLVRSARPKGVLVVGLYRPSEVDAGRPLRELVTQLRREALIEEIALDEVDDRDAAALVEQVTGERLTPRLAAALRRQSGGNPLFIVEMLRHLRDRGLLDEAAAAAAAGRELPAVLPPAAGEVIAHRLERLDEDALAAVRLAAVIGEEFDLALLSELSGTLRDALLEALAPAVSAGLLARDADDPERHRFAHALIRSAAYDQFGATRRAELHRRVGQALESLASADPDSAAPLLAHHYFCARSIGEAPRAIDYALRAARRAEAGLAFEQAAAFYERALAAMDVVGASSDARCDALLGLGEARANAGLRAEARESFGRAAALARVLGSAEQLGRAAVGFAGKGHGATGAVDADAVALLDEAAAALAGGGSEIEVRVLSRLAVELYWSAEVARRREAAERAVRLARAIGHPGGLAAALNAQVWATWGPDNLRERFSLGEEGVALATEAGDHELALECLTWWLVVLLEEGIPEDLEDRLDHYEELADEFGQAPYVLYSIDMRAGRALSCGRYEEAAELTAEIARRGWRFEDPNTDGIVMSKLIWTGLERGGGEFEAHLPTVETVAEALPRMPVWRALLARMYLLLDRRDDAHREFERMAVDDFAGIPRDMFWLMTVALNGELAAGLDDAPRARALYPLLLPFAGRNVTATFDLIWGSADRILASLAATAGDLRTSAGHFEDALELNAAWDLPAWLAHTRCAYGEMLLQRDDENDRARAMVLLREADAAARELGMTVLARRTSALAGEPA